MMNSKELIGLFEFNYNVMKINFEGIDADDSVKRPMADVNSINWILGHIIASRFRALSILENKKLFDQKLLDTYNRGHEHPDARKLYSWDSLIDILHKSQEMLREELKICSNLLDNVFPGKGIFRENEKYWEILAFLAQHETYHVGQTGMGRKIIGKGGAIK